MIRFIIGMLAAVSLTSAAQAGVRVSVSFPAAAAAKPLDGRIILLFSRDFTRGSVRKSV